MNLSFVTIFVIVLLSVVHGGRRVHRAKRSPKNLPKGANIQGKRGLSEMIAALLPNTYYSRPKFRYPYYHRDGKEVVFFSIISIPCLIW